GGDSARAARRRGVPVLDSHRPAREGKALHLRPLLSAGAQPRDRRGAETRAGERGREEMGRDRHPAADPQRRRQLRGARRRAHVAVRRRPPHDARAAVEFLLRPGHDEAQGVLRPSPGAPMTEYREADFSRLKTVSIAQRPNKVDPSLLGYPTLPDRIFYAFSLSPPLIPVSYKPASPPTPYSLC